MIDESIGRLERAIKVVDVADIQQGLQRAVLPRGRVYPIWNGDAPFMEG